MLEEGVGRGGLALGVLDERRDEHHDTYHADGDRDEVFSNGLAEVLRVELAVVSIDEASWVCARIIPMLRVSMADATADLFT